MYVYDVMTGERRFQPSPEKGLLPPPADLERAERLRETLGAVVEANRHAPVIVEGRKDAAALRRLGLGGEIIVLHAGKTIHEFCEELIKRYDRVVLLMDWDPKGEALMKRLGQGLSGLWEEFSPLRDVLRILCQKDVKDVEGIPALLRRLGGTAPPAEPIAEVIDR